MAGTNKPDRVGSKYVKNFEGRGMGKPGQGAKPPRISAATANGMKGNSMAQPNNASGNQPARSQASKVGKAAYKRSHVGVTPTGLPMKRTPNGSVLTGKSQPHARGKSQNMPVRKGAD